LLAPGIERHAGFERRGEPFEGFGVLLLYTEEFLHLVRGTPRLRDLLPTPPFSVNARFYGIGLLVTCFLPPGPLSLDKELGGLLIPSLLPCS
jgi:hypothetical protein